MLAQIFNLKDQVALRLREARETLSLKPMDLANAAGVSRATQYNYESGQTPRVHPAPDAREFLREDLLLPGAKSI